MRELSASLTELIAIAEGIVLRGRPQTPAASFSPLAAEIHHAHAMPADGPRCTHAAMLMLAAIDGWRATDAGMVWIALIGAALPLLREEAFRAICSERDARQEGNR
jgi:hypothetical protein